MLLVSSRKERRQGAGEPESPGTWKRRAAPRADVPSFLVLSWSSRAFSLMVYAMLMERKMDFEEEPSLLVELLEKPQWNTKIPSKGDVAQRLKIIQNVRFWSNVLKTDYKD